MLLDLQRAFTPEEMVDYDCGLCRREFRVESVIAVAMTDDRMDAGRICPECIEYLRARAPEKCPTIEEYRELLRKYPEPMYASYGEMKAAAEASGYYDDPAFFVYDDRWIWQAAREEAPA